ncbi:MAG: hypothetical protein EB101_12735 [Chitinophagia bacterium]|nr:hypothetical protein [Chitinophagia bacterium]
MWALKKERTNVYLHSQIKKEAMVLADRSGMSLSVFITQLLLKEVAKEQGVFKESPARLAVKSREKKK